MRRVLVVGLPRSGTTWLAHILGAPPVRTVVEPDNFRNDILAWAGTLGLGFTPSLEVGEQAPAYRRLWEIAFAGGWPDHPAVRALRRAAGARAVPRPARIRLALAAARIASTVASPPEVVLVKTVFAGLSTEWLAHEFDPAMVIAWRHPLNLVPSWVERGYPAVPWNAAEAVRARFGSTALWPPPSEQGLEAMAWTVCARTVVMLEAASRHPGWLVVGHEDLCVDPLAAFGSVLSRLGIREPADLAARLADTDQPGTGYEVRRATAMEPGRWRTRLTTTEQEVIVDVVRRFGEESGVAAKAWSASPAVAPAAAPD